MVFYILYLVLVFFIYFNLYWLIAWHPPFIWPPFYIGLPHLVSPVYLVIKDQFILFLFVIHSLLLLMLPLLLLMLPLLLLLLSLLILVKSSSAVDCSYLQDVLEL
jgi:hypothetical protein